LIRKLAITSDDTKRYVDALDLSDADRAKAYEGNARRVYPRLDAALSCAESSNALATPPAMILANHENS
jgi:hypothetical protein